MLGTEATPERVANLRAELGLDKPLHIQFKDWLIKVLHGDLGRSFFLDRPVTTAILERIPATFLLAVAALIIAVLIGIPLGVIAAVKQGSLFDRLFMAIAVVGVSVPSFWLGLMMILIFCVNLGWLPSGGYIPMTENFLECLRRLVMPAFSLGIMQSALIARITRSSMLEVIRLDYICTAMAKGLKEYKVIMKHAFMNITTSLITVVAMAFGNLLGGAVIVETVFTYPGVGRLVVQAVTTRDYPLIQGILLVIATSYVMVNLLADLLYPIFDPRIRYD
jgi:peptide/nickel transport system permease protein